jgi:hypothetical protein
LFGYDAARRLKTEDVVADAARDEIMNTTDILPFIASCGADQTLSPTIVATAGSSHETAGQVDSRLADRSILLKSSRRPRCARQKDIMFRNRTGLRAPPHVHFPMLSSKAVR